MTGGHARLAESPAIMPAEAERGVLGSEPERARGALRPAGRPFL
jgi:hypothetical protein